jgi:hypothetical protein
VHSKSNNLQTSKVAALPLCFQNVRCTAAAIRSSASSRTSFFPFQRDIRGTPTSAHQCRVLPHPPRLPIHLYKYFFTSASLAPRKHSLQTPSNQASAKIARPRSRFKLKGGAGDRRVYLAAGDVPAAWNLAASRFFLISILFVSSCIEKIPWFCGRLG